MPNSALEGSGPGQDILQEFPITKPFNQLLEGTEMKISELAQISKENKPIFLHFLFLLFCPSSPLLTSEMPGLVETPTRASSFLLN